jgi:chorismate mutase/prephenate dehydratase
MTKPIPLLPVLFVAALLACAGAPPTETKDQTRPEANSPADGNTQSVKEQLSEWRNQIDTVDRELVALLNRRAGYVLKLAPLKRQIGVAVKDPGREQQVLDKLRAANSGPLTDESLEKIYATIMAAMRDLQAEK